MNEFKPGDHARLYLVRLVQYAMSESVGIFGLVYFFMVGDFQKLLMFLAAAAVSMIFLYPNRG